MATRMTIGKMADASGVNIETIRYYQRRGLLIEPPKPLEGYRHYEPEQAKRVRFIKRAQALGFTLDEVGALFTLDTGCACDETRTLAVRKITDLAAIRKALGGLVNQCDAGDGHASCPIIDVLASD